MNNIERQLQLCHGRIEKWASENGFKFSSSKTVGMHFCNKRKLHLDPELTLYGNPIKMVDETKFLELQHYAEIKASYSDFSTVYTDGSKDGDRVASAAVFRDRAATLRLPSAASIFTAEAEAIILALKFIASSDKSKFIICSDSLSCLQAIQNTKIKNPTIL